MTESPLDSLVEPTSCRQAGWWKRFRSNFFPLAPGDLVQLLYVKPHSLVFNHQRAHFVLQRTHLIANWAAVFILLWILVEALIFPDAIWQVLALGRISAALALVVLSAYCHRAVSLTQGYVAVVLLFFIPSVFFLFLHATTSNVALSGIDSMVTSSYAFAPFVLVAGIGLFPLTLTEVAALGLLLMIVSTIHVISQHYLMMHGLTIEGLWMLSFVVAIAGLSGLSQLQLMHRLFAQSSFDSLTGVYNRTSGNELMGLHFVLARRYQYPLALVFMDLDDFKKINDTAGHEAGDKILAQTAQAWRTALREGDCIVRWGGEEFIMLLPHTTCALAEQLIQSRKPALQRPDGRLLTWSIGIAERIEDHVTAINDLVALADERMYQAKTSGKARIVAGPLSNHPAKALTGLSSVRQ